MTVPQLIERLSLLLPNVAETVHANPFLTPGAGFTAPTPQPPQVGTGPAADEKAIARWDVVPWQTFDGFFNVGIVAFHINGIHHVDFCVNNGPISRCSKPTLNPHSGVVEYWATLDSYDLGSAPVQVDVVAYPVAGVPRVLERLVLHSNTIFDEPPPTRYVSFGGDDANEGTETKPYKTLMRAMNQVADGGTIVLLDAGEWVLPQSMVDHRPHKFGGPVYAGQKNQRWITIKPKAGIKREDIVFSLPAYGRYSPYMNRLKWQGVSFDAHTLQYYDLGVWFDNCRWFNSAGWTEALAPIIRPQSPTARNVYVTDSLAENLVYGFTQANLVRGSTVRHITGDCYQESMMVVNCVADDVDGLATPHHTDVFQYFGDQENTIVYGFKGINLKATQNFYANFTAADDKPKLWNCAFVNVDFDNVVDGPPYSQFWFKHKHVLFRNFRWHNQRLVIRTDVAVPRKFNAENELFDTCTFHPDNFRYHVTPGLPGVEFRSCIKDATTN